MRGIVRSLGNVTFRMGTVVAIDVTANTLTLAGSTDDPDDVVEFDTLVLAAGAAAARRTLA